jgi:hypothetical protein
MAPIFEEHYALLVAAVAGILDRIEATYAGVRDESDVVRTLGEGRAREAAGSASRACFRALSVAAHWAGDEHAAQVLGRMTGDKPEPAEADR